MIFKTRSLAVWTPYKGACTLRKHLSIHGNQGDIKGQGQVNKNSLSVDYTLSLPTADHEYWLWSQEGTITLRELHLLHLAWVCFKAFTIYWSLKWNEESKQATVTDRWFSLHITINLVLIIYQTMLHCSVSLIDWWAITTKYVTKGK